MRRIVRVDPKVSRIIGSIEPMAGLMLECGHTILAIDAVETPDGCLPCETCIMTLGRERYEAETRHREATGELQ